MRSQWRWTQSAEAGSVCDDAESETTRARLGDVAAVALRESTISAA